jgi:3-dehydroquinate dehydratase I
MKKPRICASIVDRDLEAAKEIEPLVDLFEVRMDLIGPDWPEMVKYLKKPWIACNRSIEEGGEAGPDEVQRIEELIWAAETGASYVDIEHRTKNLKDIVLLVKSRAECLISYHDVVGTPSYDTLVNLVESQLKAGADVCKVVTTALTFEDNLTVLKLIHKFPEVKIVSFAMGEMGAASRVLCPLVGGYFTFGCIARGKEAAPGQLTVRELNEIYGYINS